MQSGETTDQQLADRIGKQPAYDRVGYGNALNAITLGGDALGPVAKESALNIAKRTLGVTNVVDRIQVDPVSPMDDRLRIEVGRRVYGCPSLNKYAINPANPISITVINGHVILSGGVVDSQADTDVALEGVKGFHHAVEPSDCIGTEGISPTQAGTKITDTMVFHPTKGVIQWIFEMKPLAEANRAVVREEVCSQLRRAITLHRAKIVMTVVRGTFCFLVVCLSRPSRWKVEEAIPVDAINPAAQEFQGALEPEGLHLFRTKGRSSHLENPDWLAGHVARLGYPVWPFVDMPMVPIKRKSMHTHNVHVFHNTVICHCAQEIAVA